MDKTHVMNPFAEDIVYDPRKVSWSLPGLNDPVLQRIDEALKLLEDHDSAHAAGGAKSPHALQVTSPRAGYGKSHLIGRLFEKFAGRATQVYVRPFEDPTTCWKSILMRLVQELQFPERHTDGQPDGDGPTQLDALAITTIARIVVDVIENLPNPPKGAIKALPELRRPVSELAHLGKSQSWRAFFKALVSDPQWLTAIHQRLVARGIMLNAAYTSWLNVLSRFALDPKDWEVRQVVLEWLRGESIDQEVAQRIGIRPTDLPEPGQPASMANQLCRERMLDLCQLAGYYRPFLFCFDQTDNYGKDPALASALGGIITDLTDQGYNQLTILTANLDPWEKRIRVHWEDAQRDRVAKPALELEDLTQEQGKRLASYRLQDWLVTAPQALAFLGDEQWFACLFQDEPRMSVRLFLQRCREHWQHLVVAPTPEPPTPLEDYFQRYQDKVNSEPRRLVFDRDTLHWIFAELAECLSDVAVERVEVRRGESLPQWRCGERRLVFGFESGYHWKTWQTIARKAQQPVDNGAEVIWVYPRTPELPTVPGEWKCADEIQAAIAGRLRVLVLDRDCMVKLWAAYDLYSDAVQGDIPYAADEITRFLQRALDDFWALLLATPLPAIPPPARSTSNLNDNLRTQIQAIVQRACFLSLEELLAKLSPPAGRDTILNACNDIPEIRVHFSPEMTLLQWRSAPSV